MSLALSAPRVSLYQGLALCSGFVLVVAVLLPAIIFSTLHTKHGRTRLDGGLGQPSDVQKFGWLFMRYSHSYYWWEVLIMFKTIVTVFCAVWMSHDPGRCAGVAMFCLLLQLVLQLTLKPMECLESEQHSAIKPAKRKGNQLQLLTIVCELLFFAISIISVWTGPKSDDRIGRCKVIPGSASAERAAPTACGVLDVPMFGDQCFQSGPCIGAPHVALFRLVALATPTNPRVQGAPVRPADASMSRLRMTRGQRYSMG